MANPGDAFPPGEDFIVRELRRLERMITENASARSLASSQMGPGDLTISGGGNLNITGGGSLNVASGALNSAGSISAGTTITAGGAITGASLDVGSGSIAGGALSGTTLTATGNASVGGSTTLGPINSTYSRGHTVTGPNYANAYWDGNGDSGVNVSSAAYKQDVTPVDLAPEIKAILSLALVRFRYISAVEEQGDSAPVEIGSIAEYVESIGLGEWVFRDPEGVVQGISYERLTIPLIAVVQSLDKRLKALEER